MFFEVLRSPAEPDGGLHGGHGLRPRDATCPTLPGAITRFSLPFVDPKIGDGTEQAAEIYDKRCRQIAREMLYVMSRIRPEKKYPQRRLIS